MIKGLARSGDRWPDRRAIFLAGFALFVEVPAALLVFMLGIDSSAG